jgi:carboxymethylenebutenolidase
MTAAVIETNDGPMPVLIGRPQGTPRGAVVVIQEAFGLTGHIASVCDRLADAGWFALAPGIYHRTGNATFDYADLPPALEVMNLLNPGDLRTDLDASYAYLEGEGFGADQTAIVGFCMGGAIAMWEGTREHVATSVTWYGGGVAKGRFGLPPLIELAPALDRPWLGLYGDLDHSIETADIACLGEAATTASVPAELVRYADAGHGFNCDDRADHYQPRAAADAWARMLAWFERYVGRESS